MSRRKQARPKALKRLSQDVLEDDDTKRDGSKILDDGSGSFIEAENYKVAIISSVTTNGDRNKNDVEMDVGSYLLDDEEEQEMYNCETCGSIFADLSTFMEHNKTDCSGTEIEQTMDSDDSPVSVEGGAYRCQFCQKTFSRLSYLKRHEQIHSDKMPFRCDYCSRLFKHKRSRDRHVKLHTGDKRYQCTQCKTCFSRSDHLKIHIRTHGTSKQFQCSICNSVLDTFATLTSHYQTCHKHVAIDLNTRALECDDFTKELCSEDVKEKRIEDKYDKISGGDVGEVISHEGELEFKCPICPEIVFENEQALLKHHKTDHQSGYMHVYSCLHCGNEYHSLYNLREHLSSIHPDGSTTIATDVDNLSHNTCVFCRITFVSSDALQAHMTGSHPSQEIVSSWALSGRFTCSQCRLQFKSDHALKEHISHAHETTGANSKEQNKFHCPHCTKEYPNKEVLRTHVDRTHTDTLNIMRYPCPYCVKQNLFDSIEQLQLHIEVYHKSNRTPMHFCSEPGCKLYFNSNVDLTSHLKNDHNLVAIEGISSNFDSMNHESAPSNKTTNDSYYSCPSCRNEFKTESQLIVHAVNHFKAVTSEYVCRDCGKSFKKPDELQKHLFEIHAHHLYKCALCKEVFDSKVSVQVHFAVKHSNECKLFSCTQCGVVYRLEDDFIMHVKTQHVKVGQRCNICGLIFSSSAQLQAHLGTHKPMYCCPYCKTAYADAPSLDVHMKSMHINVLSSLIPHYTKTSKPLSHPTVNKHVNVPRLDDQKSIKISSHHSSDDGEEGCFICQICDEKFPLKTLLERHHAKEHDIKSRRLTPDGYTSTSSASITNMNYEKPQETSNYNSNIFKQSSQPSHGVVCMFCRNAILGENDLVFHSKKHKQSAASESDTSYYCVVCMLHLTSMRNLRIHAHFHFQTSSSDDSRPQNCVMCGENFRPTNNDESPVCIRCISLDTQFNRFTNPSPEFVDKKPAEYRCSHCNVKFESDYELTQHMSVHNEVTKKTYQCIKCQKTFSSEGEIHAHVTSHMLAEGIYHECKLCKEVFDSPGKLQCHLIDHTFADKNYQCPKCDAKFLFAVDIQTHAIEHGIEAREHKCDLCNQTFFFSAELMNHGASYHHFENGRFREEYRCYECGRQFISRSNLYSHMKTHTAKERVCRCPLCPEVFLNTLAMQQHYFKSHTEVELVRSKKTFKCTKCEKTFSCSTALQNHTTQHNQMKGYSCTECGKTFCLVRYLTVHMAIHSSPTPFKCPLCDKLFSKIEQRKKHLKSHFNVTQFACRNCTQTFSNKSQIQKHMLSHVTGSTTLALNSSYKCYVCRATFADEPMYKQHMQRMHGVQYDQSNKDYSSSTPDTNIKKNTIPFQRGSFVGVPENCCPMCNAMFPNGVALHGHLQTFHRIKFSADKVCYVDDSDTPCMITDSKTSNIQELGTYKEPTIPSRNLVPEDCHEKANVDKERLNEVKSLHQGYQVRSKSVEKLLCPLCDDCFSTPQSMRRHLKRAHGAKTSKRRKIEEKEEDGEYSKDMSSRNTCRDHSHTSDGNIMIQVSD